MRRLFGLLMPIIRMVAQRSVGHGRLFAAMTTGAVISAALMACVVVYSDAIRDLGLEYAIRTQPDRDIDVEVVSTSQSMVGAEFEHRKTTTDALLAAQVGDITTGVVHYGRTATFYLGRTGQPLATDEKRPRAHIQYVDDLAGHVRVVEGQAPAELPPGGEDAAPTIEVWASTAAAAELGFGLGDSFDLHPHWRSDKAPVTAVVVGLIEAVDPDEEYWFGKTDRFTVTDTSWPTFPFFASESSLRDGLGSYLPDLDASFETFAFVEEGRIDYSNARSIEDRMRGLEGALRAQIQFTQLNSSLADTIQRYREQLFFTRLPLFALMVQIVGIALFYLVMVSTAVVERQAGEVALMKSRGASNTQVLGVFAIEGLGICAIATVAGPFIAAACIAVLGLTPPFEELSNGDLLEVSAGSWAFAMAALGALMAFVALMWPAYRASRLSVTHYKAAISRPQSQPAFLRYYGDLVVVAIGAFAFYQLRERGSLVTESVFGDLSADPLLLATPSLFMLMTALVFLRLFPLALRLVLWLTRRVNGPTISLGLTRMSRAPLQHSRLILLLILTTAVGMFAAGFRATLERGYEDRAAYRAGSELRMVDIREPASQPQEHFRAAVEHFVPGRDMAIANRMDGTFNATRFQTASFTLLSVEAQKLKNLGFWRDDFAGDSFGGLLDSVTYVPPTPAPPEGVAIPEGARYIGLWIKMELPATLLSPGLRLVDADGGVWEYRLATEKPANVATPGWQFVMADLQRPFSKPGLPFGAPAGSDQRPQGATLEAVFIAMPGNLPQQPQSLAVFIDDVTVSAVERPAAEWGTAGFADGTVVEPFDELGRYELIRGVSLEGNPGAVSSADAPDGRSGKVARLGFIRGRGGNPMVGLRGAGDAAPLKVVVAKQFLDEYDKKAGDQFVVYVNRQYVDVQVVGSFELFPGWDPDKDYDLFVTDYAAFLARTTRVPFYATPGYPNEAWMGAGAGTYVREELLESGFRVETILDRAGILEEQRSDPLVAASWEGILFLAFAAVLLLSGLGFVIYSGLSAKTRGLEFAILRTMGLSGKQILGVVSFEHVFVIASGVLAGTLLGFPLSRLMIGYMGLTENGEDPLPPLLSRVSWEAVATVYSLLAIVVVATVATLVVLYSRVAVSRALRAGDL